MAWFALVVAVLAVVHFAIAYPGFRRVLVWCGAGALALVAGVVAGRS